eukprot:3389088-Karenia_brevis.AAC.1
MKSAINRRIADVHKSLVSASRTAKGSKLMCMFDNGGSIVERDSRLGRKVAEWVGYAVRHKLPDVVTP